MWDDMVLKKERRGCAILYWLADGTVAVDIPRGGERWIRKFAADFRTAYRAATSEVRRIMWAQRNPLYWVDPPPKFPAMPDPNWRWGLWKTSRVFVRGARGEYYFVVHTPDGERHDSRDRVHGLRIFYSSERAQRDGETFDEEWWMKHRWEASQSETLTHRGVEVKLRKLKHARAWWWRVDATVGEGLERTKKEAIAAAKANIADSEAYLRSKGYSI